MSTNFFQLYKKYQKEIDNLCDRLSIVHQKHLQCREGCAMCCKSFKILPVEFYAIQEEIQDKNIKINNNPKSGECKFLVNNKCTIYENRPIICRTHGLPLARLIEDAGAYEISYCELNFKEFSLDKFNNNNVYFEDENNQKIYELNKKFIKYFKLKKYGPLELVEVYDLTIK